MRHQNLSRRQTLMLFGGAATYGGIAASVVEDSVDNVETHKYILNTEEHDEVLFSFEDAENIRMELESVENSREAVLKGYESGEMYEDRLVEGSYDTDEIFDGELDELPDVEVTRVKDMEQYEGIILEFNEVLEGEYI